MKTRRLLKKKTKRYVGKGYRAFFGFSRKPTSEVWCRPFGDANIRDTIKKRVSKLFETSNSDVITIYNAVVEVTTHTGVFENRGAINYTVQGFIDSQTPVVVNPKLSIYLPENTIDGDECVLRFMQYNMINLRESALNIITKIRNDKRFRSSHGVCRKRGQTGDILNENDSKATIVDGIIQYLKVSRKEAFTGRDTRYTRYKLKQDFTSEFTYEDLKQYILGPNQMHVTNISLIHRNLENQAALAAALGPEQLADPDANAHDDAFFDVQDLQAANAHAAALGPADYDLLAAFAPAAHAANAPAVQGGP